MSNPEEIVVSDLCEITPVIPADAGIQAILLDSGIRRYDVEGFHALL
jgi:hypothetical protein